MISLITQLLGPDIQHLLASSQTPPLARTFEPMLNNRVLGRFDGTRTDQIPRCQKRFVTHSMPIITLVGQQGLLPYQTISPTISLLKLNNDLIKAVPQ